MIANIIDQIRAATYELNALNNLLEAREKLRNMQQVAAVNQSFRDRPYHNMRVISAQALVYQYENQLKDIHHV